MKRQTRLLIGLAVAFAALVLIGVAVQTIRSLLWDLSYFLPPWLLTPMLLLGFVLLATVAVQVGWPMWRRLKTRPAQRQSQPTAAPQNRRDAATTSLGHVDRLIERCLLYTSPSPRDGLLSRMPSSA